MVRMSSKGSTLVEMVVAVSILSIVSTSLVALVMHSIKGWSEGTSYNNAVNTATVAMQKLYNDIRDGRTATASSGYLIVVFPLKITDPNTHEQIYDPSANSSVIVSYHVDSAGNLIKSTNGVTTTIARGITSAVFGANGGLVTITLTAKDRTGTQNSETIQQVDGRISLRNYKS